MLPTSIHSFFPFPHISSLQVHVPNNCEFGTKGEVEEADFDDLLVKDPEELKKDPHTCFFENQHHAHGSHWTPNYDKCFSCSCQVKTSITKAEMQCVC